MKLTFKHTKIALGILLVLFLGSIWINMSQEAQINDLREQLQIMELNAQKQQSGGVVTQPSVAGAPAVPDFRDNYQRIEDSLVAVANMRKEALKQQAAAQQMQPGIDPSMQVPSSTQPAPSIQYNMPTEGTPGVVGGGAYSMPTSGDKGNRFKDMNKGY